MHNKMSVKLCCWESTRNWHCSFE